MNRLIIASLLMLFALAANAQTVKKDIAYASPAADRQILDIYAPDGAKNLPVVFWIHGGGWQAGDKSDVGVKPKYFMDKGFVVVSTNYRLLPKVDMGTIIRDVAKSLGWVHKHIAEYGGAPSRIIVGGHSAGAQLAAIVCTDESYIKAEVVPLSSVVGCVPVDGDTYDVPAIIEVAETRARVHEFPPIKNGHRAKFGNTPENHRKFSAVYHVSKGKGIPPFLIVYVADHPDTSAQARRLGDVLKASGIPVKLYGGRETSHSKINNDLGVPGGEGTKNLDAFLAEFLKK
ncbi:MAG: alpha/beta hydrolase [bacterium]